MSERSRAGREASQSGSRAAHSAVRPFFEGSSGARGEMGSSFQGRSEPLSDRARRFFEPRFGASLSDVRLVRSGPAATAARYAGGAVTHGSTIALPPRASELESGRGLELIAHELTHVVQQGGRGAAASGEAQEREARASVRTLLDGPSARTPLPLQAAAAASPAWSLDDWLQSTRDVRTLSFTELVADIDEIEQWLSRQTSTTAESGRLEEALAELTLERQRRAAAALGPRPRARARRRSAARATAPEATAPQAEASQDSTVPAILRERASVVFDSREEVAREIDLIMAWLARDSTSRQDRELLNLELQRLAPQFEADRAQSAASRQAQRLQQALAEERPVSARERVTRLTQGLPAMPTELERVTQVLQSLQPSPDQPGVFLIFHENEQVAISEQQVQQLRSEISSHFRRARGRATRLVEAGFDRRAIQIAINDDHPVVSTISGWLGGVDDPIAEMQRSSRRVSADLDAMDRALAAGDFATAATDLTRAVSGAARVQAAGRAFSEGYIDGASVAVRGLEITRDVSFAVSGSIAAVVAAPVVAAGAAGAGLTGGSAALVTTLGTGAVVGTGTAVVRGGSAGAGELAAGGSLSDAASAARSEGRRGLREGFVTGATGGLARSLGTTLGVGREGISAASQVGRRVAAEGAADFAGGAANEALRGGSLSDSLRAGGVQAIVSVPGSAAGAAFRNPTTSAVAGTLASAGGGFSGSLATGGTLDEALLSGAIAATSSTLVRRAGDASPPTTRAEQRAFELGQRGRARVDGTLAAAGEAVGGVLTPGLLTPEGFVLRPPSAEANRAEMRSTGSSGGSRPPRRREGLTDPSREASPIAEPSAAGRPTQIPADADPDTARSLRLENEAAIQLARAGYEVEQNPQVAGTRNPDLRVEGRIFDVYSPNYRTSARNIFGNIKDKILAGQTTRVVVNLDESSVSIPRLARELSQRRGEVRGLDEVLVVRNGTVRRIYP